MNDAVSLTTIEQQELEQHEAVIERGLKTFYEVGTALVAIRDKRLYKAHYATFEEYCQQRWNLERRRAYQLMDAAGVVENVNFSSQNPPQLETHARPLVALEPEAQRIVWEVVQQTAPSGKVTADHVKSVASVFKDVVKTQAIDPGTGEDIHVPEVLKAVITEETYERWQRQQAHLKERDEKRERDRQKRLEDIQTLKVVSELSGTYPILYADPPWQYEHVKTPVLRAIENHYETQGLDWICNLKIDGRSPAEVAGDNAMLFLWATSPKLAEAMQVIEAWGFTYRTSMVWDKDTMGMGDYARIQHELLLIARRGNIRTPDTAVRPRSVWREKSTEHSAKPHQFYEFIELMYPEYRKLELFARNAREGWQGWGYEYDTAA